MKKSIDSILLISGIIIVTIISIMFNSSLLTFSCAFVSVYCAVLTAKGKTLGNLFGIAQVILYSIISFNNHLYGEVIIYMLIMLPLYIYSIISWKLNERKDSKTVIAYEITGLEWAILSASEVLLFTIVYFFLDRLNTEQLLLSTFSFVSLIYTIYLSARRSKYSFIWYLMNDIILVILWLAIAIYNKNIEVIAIIVSPFLCCIYDVYGFICWEKNNENIVKISDLTYKKLSKKDMKNVLKMVNDNNELKNLGHYIPYTKNELDNLFKTNDILLYGIFDKNKLVGKSELFLNQDNISEVKKILGLEKYKVCQISRVLDTPGYKNKNILKTLIKLQIENAKEMAFNYIAIFVHPQDIVCKKAIKAAGFEYVKTATLSSGLEREFYIIKV